MSGLAPRCTVHTRHAQFVRYYGSPIQCCERTGFPNDTYEGRQVCHEGTPASRLVAPRRSDPAERLYPGYAESGSGLMPAVPSRPTPTMFPRNALLRVGPCRTFPSPREKPGYYTPKGDALAPPGRAATTGRSSTSANQWLCPGALASSAGHKPRSSVPITPVIVLATPREDLDPN